MKSRLSKFGLWKRVMKTDSRENRNNAQRGLDFSKDYLINLLVPLVLEQILALGCGLADSVMVSAAGEMAVAGVSLVDSINYLLINLFSSLATGGAVAATHRLGQKKPEEASRVAGQLIYSETTVAILVASMAIVFRIPLLGALFGTAEPDILNAAEIYLLVTALSFPFIGLYNACAALSRAMGDSETTMLVSFGMDIFNIAGNAFFIFVMKWGVFGVALSTLLARAVSATVMLWVMRNPGREIHLSRTGRFRPDADILKEIFRVGIPTGMDACVFQAGKIILQRLVVTLGTAAIAANSIAGTVAGIAVIPAQAVGLAMVPIVGQLVGAHEFKKAEQYVWRLLRYAEVFMLILNVFIVLFSGKLAGMYMVSKEAVSLAAGIIIMHSVMAVIFWPAGFALPNAIRAASDAIFTMSISLLCMWVFRIGLSYLFVEQFHWGLYGIWLAMGADWAVRSLVFLLYVRSGRWLAMYRKTGMNEAVRESAAAKNTTGGEV